MRPRGVGRRARQAGRRSRARRRLALVGEVRHTSHLYLPYTSPASPLYLPYISPAYPLHLPCISPASPRCVASVLAQQRCADACLRQPKPPFMRSLLGAIDLPCVSPVSPLYLPAQAALDPQPAR